MTITARNYSAQARRGLINFASRLPEEMPTGKLAINCFSLLIDKAIHFAIPDGGRIFDDGLRGLEGKKLRLPYPTITIEWHELTQDSSDTRQVDKRVLIASEIAGDDDEIMIVVYSAYHFCDGEWELAPVGYRFQESWDRGRPSGERGVVPFDPFPISDFEFCFESAIKRHDDGIMVGQAGVILEFLEALACSNVTHEPIEPVDPRKNAKRIKAGKLPIYETRILTIEAGKQGQGGTGQGGSHASPRQHLRRGHIRRLADKNIWVNACVVGKAETGVIDKQYHVKAA